MTIQKQKQHGREQGFTLIELLVAIVVVGILTTVAIVGIGGLTDKGTESACKASADAAEAASAVFYANSGTQTWPADFADLVAPVKTYKIPDGVTPNPPGSGDKVLSGAGTSWTLTMTGGGAAEPVFTCT